MTERSWVRATLEAGAFALIRVNPRLGIRIVGSLGPARARVQQFVTPAQVAAVAGPRPARELRRIADEVETTSYRNGAIDLLVERRGLEMVSPMIRLVHPERFTALRARGRSVVIVLTHLGPLVATIAMLAELGETALLVRGDPRRVLPRGFECALANGEDARAQALKRAAERLRSGGIVVMALEGATGVPTPMPMLGKLVSLARGPMVLSRLTGATIVPVTTLWQPDATIEIEVHEPIPRPDVPADAVEAALAPQLARFIGTVSRTHTGQLAIPRLIDLAKAPVLGQAPA